MFTGFARLPNNNIKKAGGIVIPSLGNDDEKPYLITDTDDIKLVSDYCLMPFSDVVELDCYTFKALLRNAFITKMRAKKEGQEYLEQCWILTQTEPEYDKLQKIKDGNPIKKGEIT